METMNNKKLDKVTASIEDDTIVFTLSGYLDQRTWFIEVNFKTQGLYVSSKEWRLENLYLSDEEEVRETLRQEYFDYIMEYAVERVEIEQVECEHDDDYVYEDLDDKRHCDRCDTPLDN